MISIIYKCADKTLPFKFIGVALCLLKFNSQWKDASLYCAVSSYFSSLCSLQAYNYAEHLYNILCARTKLF